MKTPILQILTLTAVSVSLAACGSPASDPLSAQSGNTAGSGGGGQAISLYTSQPDADVTAMVAAFNQANPGTKVNVFRSGTEEVTSKLQAEKQAGAAGADVIFIADALSMEKLKGAQLLAKYTSSEASGIDKKYIDAEGFYTGTKLIATGIAINTDKVKTAPDSWKVFTRPEAKGAAEMASPLYSGAAAYNVALFAANPDFGWDYWQAVAANGMTVSQGNGAVLKDVASGTKSYAMVVEFIVARAAAQGSPVKFIYPNEGVPAVTEPIALASSAKNSAGGKQFIDFVLSEKGQEVESKLGYVPVRPQAPVPPGLKGVSDVKVLEGDLKQLSGSVDQAKDKFKTMFHQ